MTLQIFLHFFHHKFVTSLQSTSLPPATSALSLRRIGDALLTSRLCLSLPHIATPAHSASEMRYSLETPFVRSAAEDAWGYRRPTHPALRRCATSPPSPPRPRERSRLQLTPDSVGGYTHRRRCAADAPPLTHYCTASTAAPPCGAYLPLHSIPGRAVRG